MSKATLSTTAAAIGGDREEWGSSPPRIRIRPLSTGTSAEATYMLDPGEMSWQELQRAMEETSLRFLRDEPDLYTLEDGEPV